MTPLFLCWEERGQGESRSRLTHFAHLEGVASATAGPAGSADAANRMVSSLAAVCEQLVQDVCDDEECYQAHFPSECQISLPAISCR